MGKIKKILENELVGGTQTTDVYPVTSTKAVYDSDNTVLEKYVQHLKKTATFAGIATPSTNPGVPDGPVFYIATTAGNYSNFGNIEVLKGETAILKWNNGTWTKNAIKPMTDFNSVFDANGKSLTHALDTLGSNISELEGKLFSSSIIENADYTNIGITFVRHTINKGDKFKYERSNKEYARIYFSRDGGTDASSRKDAVKNDGTGNLIGTFEADEDYAGFAVWSNQGNKISIWGDAIKDIHQEIYNIDNSFERLEDSVKQNTDRIDVIEKDINGAVAIEKTVTIVSTSTSYTDISLPEAIPSGSTLTQVVCPINAYLITVDGKLITPLLSRLELPYTLSETITKITANGNGTIQLKYVIGQTHTGLKEKVALQDLKIKVLESKVTNYNYQIVYDQDFTPYGTTFIPFAIKKGDEFYYLRTNKEYARIYYSTDGGKTTSSRVDAVPNDGSGQLEGTFVADADYKGFVCWSNQGNKISINANSNVAYEVDTTLRGRTIVAFGDSITELGSLQDKGGMRYSDYIEKMYRCNVINVGVGGSQLRQRATPSIPSAPTSYPIDGEQTPLSVLAGMDIVNMVRAAVSGDYSIPLASATWIDNYVRKTAFRTRTEIVDTLRSIDWNKVDIVTVFGGTNDWRNGGNLGNYESSTDDTTLGALQIIIDRLLTAYPHIKLYVFTPIVRWIQDTGVGRDDSTWCDVYVNQFSESKKLSDYADAIKELSKINHLPVCDMYYTLGWNKKNFSNYFMSHDGTHPFNGFDVIGRKIASFILSNKIC